MASKNSFYFSHDCNAREDEKLIALRMDRGSSGYGIYWLLLELLAAAPNCEFERNYNKVAYVIHESAKDIKAVVENYDLFQFTQDEKFYSSRLKEQMDAVKDLKNKRSQSAKQRWEDANAMQMHEKTDANAMQMHEKTDANAMQMHEKMDANAMQMHTYEKEKENEEEKKESTKENKEEDKEKEEKKGDKEKKEKTSSKTAGKPPEDEAEILEDNGILINYAQLINYWNTATGGKCGRLESIDNNRRRLTRARIITHGKKKFQEAIDRAAKSEFLMGSPWFNFDWLVRPNNFDKVITGNYDNKPNATDAETRDDPRKHVTKPTGGGFTADF